MTRFRRARSPQDGIAGASTTTGLPRSIWALLSMLLLLVMPRNGWGYRPFRSIDAAVADLCEVEIEFSDFTVEYDRGENTFTI